MSSSPEPVESSDAVAPDAPKDKRFPCKQCGAKLVFKPGIAALKCEYCGFENPIPQSEDEIHELDFRAYFAQLVESEETREAETVKCDACGAEVERPEHATAFECPFCGTDIVAQATSKKLIKPKSLLPFHVTRDQARTSFRTWLKGLWFAPNKLKQYARQDTRLNGMYVPHWTYDCNTTSHYRGERGDDYWETQTYTTTENGRAVTKTRQVRKTRWTYVSGVVWDQFDDVLVVASESLPKKHIERLEPWDLQNLVPYSDEYLSGFRAESYQIDLVEGFTVAKDIMDETIRQSVRRDIGGDHQRIHSVRTQYDDITFKHILLPVWISAYRFNQQVYRFLVNARTGEVQGERPWSWIKIALFVLVILVVLGTAAYFVIPYFMESGGSAHSSLRVNMLLAPLAW